MLNTTDPGQPIGITRAASRGVRTVYGFVGRRGLEDLSSSCAVTAPDPDAFHARLVSAPLEDVAFEDFTASTGFTVHRAMWDIARVPADIVRVTLMVEGAAEIRTERAEISVRPGQMVAIRMSAPFIATFTGPSRHATVAIPTRLLNLQPGRVDVIDRSVLPETALSGTFAAITRELAARAPDDNTVDSEHLARALVDITRALARTRWRAGGGGTPDDLARQRVYELVEREHADPALRREVIARRLRVSVSYLHRLFADEPLTIAQLIRQRRVEAIACDLRQTDEPFEALARKHGFGSTDAAHRGFRQMKGMTPTAYRRAAAHL